MLGEGAEHLTKHLFDSNGSRKDAEMIGVNYTPVSLIQKLSPKRLLQKCSESAENVPYSLALRLKHICSDSDTFESRVRELSDHLCKRGHQKQAISRVTERARQQKREDLLSYNPKSESSVLLFVLTYHPDLPKVRDIINKYWPIIVL